MQKAEEAHELVVCAVRLILLSVLLQHDKMAKGRKSSTADSNIVASSQTNMTRRRDPMTPPPATGVTLGPNKIINAAPSLQNSKPGLYPNARLTIPRAIGIAGAKLDAACPGLFSGLLPALFTWGLTVGLIFGGCCSNVGIREMSQRRRTSEGC